MGGVIKASSRIMIAVPSKEVFGLEVSYIIRRLDSRFWQAGV
jgi:hypothetical protein